MSAGLATAPAALAPVLASAATIPVDVTNDELNGDGDCSLREAVQAANTNAVVGGCESGDAGIDTIELPSSPAGYELNRGHDGEDANLEGDLDVVESLTLAGQDAYAYSQTIDAGITDRAIDVRDGPDPIALTLEQVAIENGDSGSENGGAIRSNQPDSSIMLSDAVLSQNSSGSDGGAVFTRGSLTLKGLTAVDGNHAGSDGGGIFADGPVTVEGPHDAFPDFPDFTAVSGNEAGRFGGGIVHFGPLSVSDFYFVGNVARRGGAIANKGGATLSITESALGGNEATDDSGGAAVFSNGDVVVTDSVIGKLVPRGGGGVQTGLPGNRGGGGLVLTQAPSLSVSGGRFVENEGGGVLIHGHASIVGATFRLNSSSQGAAILNRGGDFSVADTRFVENVSGYSGGAIQHEAGVLEISRSEFEGNRLTDDFHGFGGAIEANGGELLIDETEFVDNVAQTSGGAIDEFGHLNMIRVSDSAFAGNQVVSDQGEPDTGLGGAIFVGYGSPLEVENATFTSNRASSGGAIGIFDGGPATFSHATIVNNRVFRVFGPPVGGGILIAGPPGASATLERSILAFNSVEPSPSHTFPSGFTEAGVAASASNCIGGGAIISGGHNIESQDTCGFNGPGDLVNTNPLLGPLADNGGSTETMGLYADSPALDAIPGADCPPPATDQRGEPRPDGAACDIGAFEGTVPGPTRKCDSHKVTIPGTMSKDVLIGTPGADVIAGGEGNDILKGTDGRDVICGDAGNDTLIGGSNRDTLTGGPGADVMKGMNGNDLLLARDLAPDTLINCDGGIGTPGIADKADLDRLPKDPDSIVKGCETKTRH